MEGFHPMTDIPDSYVEAVRGNVCPTVEEQIKADCTAAIADLESRLAATRDELARSYERAGHGAPVPDDLREVVADALYEVIGHDAYDCTRDWTAWSCGTMRPGDFAEVADRVDEIRDHVLSAITAAAPLIRAQAFKEAATALDERAAGTLALRDAAIRCKSITDTKKHAWKLRTEKECAAAILALAEKEPTR